VLQAALQAAWAEILIEMASSFHGLDSPSKAALMRVAPGQGSNIAEECNVISIKIACFSHKSGLKEVI
jgi:hypothetical protein